MPTREDAWKLLCEYTQSESLRKDMLAVEACVRAYARKSCADEETWGLAALLHDFDYERWPNQEHSPDQGHPSEGAKILRQQDYSEEIVRAILSHADYCDVPRQSALEHTLFACDELAGFLTACAYVRPSKSILDLEVDSVKRRLKDKLFAKGVSREDVRKGAEELGIPLEEHITFCIAAVREHADRKSTRLNSSHITMSYAVFCLKKKNFITRTHHINFINIILWRTGKDVTSPPVLGGLIWPFLPTLKFISVIGRSQSSRTRTIHR